MGRSALKSEELDLDSKGSIVASSDLFLADFANKRVPPLLDVNAVVVKEVHRCNVSPRMRTNDWLILCMFPMCYVSTVTVDPGTPMLLYVIKDDSMRDDDLR